MISADGVDWSPPEEESQLDSDQIASQNDTSSFSISQLSVNQLGSQLRVLEFHLFTETDLQWNWKNKDLK